MIHSYIPNHNYVHKLQRATYLSRDKLHIQVEKTSMLKEEIKMSILF